MIERKKSKKKKLSDPLMANTAEEGGRLAPIASSILMTVLYAARMARFDLLRATNRLARYITKWSYECDRKFKKLMDSGVGSLEEVASLATFPQNCSLLQTVASFGSWTYHMV